MLILAPDTIEEILNLDRNLLTPGPGGMSNIMTNPKTPETWVYFRKLRYSFGNLHAQVV